MRVEKVGRYEVLATLARGGMGVVYKARDPLIDRVVAIKALGLGLSPIEAEGFRKRFAREAKSAGRLNHPNIVTIHDMGESEDGAYIAMEFLEGRTLRDLLESGVVLRPAAVAEMAIQIAEGLAFAHRNEVIHCDIKPSNIMVLDSGTVKIMDFGIAMLPTGSRTFAGNVLGSPRYISPEQIVGRPVDARSDIFALGAVLYEMLTGVPPFAGTAIDEILYQVINEKPAPPSKRNGSLPPAFDAIVARAMAKHPDDRYQRAQDMAAALRELAVDVADGLPTLPPLAPVRIAAPRPGASTVQLEPVAHRASSQADAVTAVRPASRLLAYAVAAIVLVAGGFMLFSPERSESDHPIAAIVSSSGDQSTSAALRQPATALPAVIPPIDLRPAAAPAAAPPMESNTIAAPSAPATVAAADAPKGQGRLGLAISPWGEVYVDGRKRGVAPPMTELRLPAGTYVVEIRNSSFAPYKRTIEIGADASVRIKHKF